MGSKVPLSLGVESFRVINRYNGMKFKFDVYLDKIESIIPKFGNKGMNECLQITKDYYAYWEPTTEKNGVEVQVEIKKHNKTAFFEAIESQLMYMPNINFLHRPQGAIRHAPVDIKANIIYKDDDVIISDNKIYDKPHILLGTGDVMINYGFVAFAELEIEPKGGSVGLMMDINDIEVTPSREAPIWSSLTRKAVLTKYEKVTETATKYVNKELTKETDYIGWIRKVTSIMGSIKGGTTDVDSVLSTLASIVDVGDIKNIKFAPDATVTFKNDIDTMFSKSFSLRLIQYDRWAKKVTRDRVNDLYSINRPVYITYNNANRYRDRYIYEENGQFVLITAKEDYDIFARASYITDSAYITNYDNVEIPEDRLSLYLNDGEDDEENDDSDLANVNTKSRAELRKTNKQIVVHTAYRNYNKEWTFSSEDTFISDMFTLNPGSKVMYGTGNDRNTLKSILGLLPDYYTKGISNTTFFSDLESGIKVKDDTDHLEKNIKLKSILVSKENLKYISTSPRFITPFEVIVDNYNSRSGKLRLSNVIKYTITSLLLKNVVNNSEHITDILGRDAFYSLAKSKKLKYLFTDLNELQAIDFIKDSTYPLTSNTSAAPNLITIEFLENLGKLHLIQENMVQISDEDKEILFKDINENLPDYLCDEIDEITEVDALFPNLYNDVMNIVDKLATCWSIVHLFENKYIPYLTKDDPLISDIKLFIKHKINDASLQQ